MQESGGERRDEQRQRARATPAIVLCRRCAERRRSSTHRSHRGGDSRRTRSSYELARQPTARTPLLIAPPRASWPSADDPPRAAAAALPAQTAATTTPNSRTTNDIRRKTSNTSEHEQRRARASSDPQSEAWPGSARSAATRPSSRTAKAVGLALMVNIELKFCARLREITPIVRCAHENDRSAKEAARRSQETVRGSTRPRVVCVTRSPPVACSRLSSATRCPHPSVFALARSLARPSDPLQPPPQRDGSPAQCDRFHPRAAHSIVTRATLSSDNRHSTHPSNRRV